MNHSIGRGNPQLDVARAFLDGVKKSASRMFTDGDTVWSWGVVIAERHRGRIYACLPPSLGGWAYSNSTSRHLGSLHDVLRKRRSVVWKKHPADMPNPSNDWRTIR